MSSNKAVQDELTPADRAMPTSIIPIFVITRQRVGQFPLRITRRDRSPQLLQLGFEKMVGDNQRLDRLAGIAVADDDSAVIVLRMLSSTSGAAQPPASNDKRRQIARG
jgi:hypothetical protein